MISNFPHNKKRTLYVGGFGEDVNEKVGQEATGKAVDSGLCSKRMEMA